MPNSPNTAAVSAAPQLEHPVRWIDDAERLAELCQHWQSLPMIAVDTEFMRTQTYYPKPALVQVNDGTGNYLIDPVAIDDLAPLKALLCDRQVIKVLHSCSEDLEVFQTLLGVVPDNIFDTQAAAALAGYGFSTGYARLIKEILGVELPKGETRSDWLQRPLSQAQVLYAAIDVEYLLVVAEKLRAQLHETGRLGWLEEDAARLASALATVQEPDQFYLRVKSAWKARGVELAILQRLAAWRESTAQRRNVPRNRVVKEHLLLTLAQDKPEHPSQLRGYEGMTERMIRTDGPAIIDIIAQTRDSDPGTWPAPLPKPLPPSSRNLMKAMKAKIISLADQLDLAPEVLLRKKDYEVLVRAATAATRRGEEAVLPAYLRGGWREQVIGEPLLIVMSAQAQGDQEEPPASEPLENGEVNE